MRRALTVCAGVVVALTTAAATTAQAGPVTAPATRGPSAGISGELVVQWNQTLLRIVRTPGAQPATVHTTRSFAIMHAAIYDAVVSVTRSGRPYLFDIDTPHGASAPAAAAQAGHDTLRALYPSWAGTLDQQLATELAAVPDGAGRRGGVRVGQLAARFMLAARGDDGADATPPAFPPGDTPGAYRPAPPAFAPAVFTHWAAVTPFLADRADQFRPDPPPPVAGRAYAQALNEVKSLGQDTSTTRTADQTVVAKFWAAPIWNYWNEITQTLVTARHTDLDQTARVFAQLDLAVADTVIAFYDAKYHYARWRPVTAVREADGDGNPFTTGDASWSPLAATPADPSYPGAHSAVSTTAAAVLASFFGDRQAVTVSSEALPGTTRTFTRLRDVATEAGLSRIFAGVHTRSDHDAGVQLGNRLARFVRQHGLR